MKVSGGVLVIEPQDVKRLNKMAAESPVFRNWWEDLKHRGAPIMPYQGGGYIVKIKEFRAWKKQVEGVLRMKVGDRYADLVLALLDSNTKI